MHVVYAEWNNTVNCSAVIFIRLSLEASIYEPSHIVYVYIHRVLWYKGYEYSLYMHCKQNEPLGMLRIRIHGNEGAKNEYVCTNRPTHEAKPLRSFF